MGGGADTRNAKAKAAKESGGSAVRMGVAGNPVVREAAAGCTDAVCAVVEAVEATPSRKQSLVRCGVGGGATLTVATTWPVTVGSMVAIAVVGSFCRDEEVTATTVAGVDCGGKLCSSEMLGWAGGAGGAAALLPSACLPGDAAPSDRPRRAAAAVDACGNTVDAASDAVEALFVAKKPKPTKEEKAAKLRAKKAAKQGLGPAQAEEEDEEPELAVASKADLKKCKKRAADRRKAGDADATTDDELDAAGFVAQ